MAADLYTAGLQSVFDTEYKRTEEKDNGKPDRFIL